MTYGTEQHSLCAQTFVRGLRACFLILVSLISMSQLSSGQIDRSKQPEPDPPPTATFPHYDEFKLRNGLKVFLVRDDRPLVTFRLLVRGGNGLDGDIPGLADAVAEQLTKGTKNRSALKFAQEIDFIGGNVGASATPDAISVTAGGLKKHMPKILELFAETVKYPAYSGDELKKYQQEQITGLKSSKARAEFLADYAVNKVLYGDTPWGRMPTEEGFRKLTPEMLRAFHESYFVPSNATLAFIGNLSKEELQQQLEAAFGDWKTNNVPTMKVPEFPVLKGRRIVLVDRPTAVQSAIRVVGKGPLLRDPERPMTYILNSILGGGTGLGNRLAMNLRETHAYTYTPYSMFDANYHMGHFVAVADVRNEVTDSALTEMLSEINRIQTEPVPADELKRNVQSAIGNFLMSIADPSTTAMRVQSIDFYGLPKNYYDRLVSAYGGTTSDDVLRLSKKYLNSDDLAVVVVGKASEVKSKLERFGTVEMWNSDLRPVGSGSATKGDAPRTNMNVQQVWDKMLTAMGGKAKLRAVKSIQTKGQIAGDAGGRAISGTYTKSEVAPNKMYTLIDFGMFKQEMVVDGKNARTSQGGGFNTLEGEDRDRMIEDSHILMEAYVDDLKGKLKMLETGEFRGQPALAVEVTYPKSGSIIYYIDPATNLPIAQESADRGTLLFGDWKDVNGIKLAHTIKLEPQAGVELTMSNMEYQINGKVDEKLFKKK